MLPTVPAPAEDPVLARYVELAQADLETLGILLHGSRANGRAREGSDYDLIRVVTQEAYDARREAGHLHERVSLDDGSVGDVVYQTPSRLETHVSTPDWFTATYLGAYVAFDRDGAVGTLLIRMRSEADRIAREGIATAYDAYLNSFVRSMKSARHGDDLGRRLHAAESALGLIRTLFGLESRWPPYHDLLGPALPDIEQAQGWPNGYLSMALSRLVGDAEPIFQVEVEERVERLMTSRGVAHEWGDDLAPLKALGSTADDPVPPRKPHR
jgi:predicted nucleotidyltransferase